MKKLLIYFSAGVACLSSALAEVNEYVGSLGQRKITVMLEWGGKGQVSGSVAATEVTGHRLRVTGNNATEGALKLTLIDGSDTIGKVELTKVVTAGSLIWSGKVRFANGESAVMEIQRKRAASNE